MRLCGEVFETILSDSSFFIYGKYLDVDIENNFSKFSNTGSTRAVNNEKHCDIRITNESLKLLIFHIHWLMDEKVTFHLDNKSQLFGSNKCTKEKPEPCT